MGSLLPPETRDEDRQQSRLLYELCALVLSILRTSSPVPIQSSGPPPSMSAGRLPPLSPAGFASLLLGMSLALMLCGSLTFMIGFFLMPWVLGIGTAFCLVGLVWNLSVLGRSILYPSPPLTPRFSRKQDARGTHT
ncbi:unnamed protein product [Spirodela intermedia]|uniref:Uncharacterized protein n=2 Tax=Spirodela intermedia TaxID=51605 RepID=A0A7I8IS21_SPIIN|nr:unnamed protein product [Spirodela intermedia]CAA6659954.1 unnamed protein product [Spirodela intermedia]CAA7396274.1 unnamed protein product [Spirodela intermedia]